MRPFLTATAVLLLHICLFSQSSTSRCDPENQAFGDCEAGNVRSTVITDETPPELPAAPSSLPRDKVNPITASLSLRTESSSTGSPSTATGASFERVEERFHWRRALAESFTFLAIEQAYVVHSDFRWVVVENGIPFNHYWRDYKQSLSAWTHSGWSDGDPNWFGYVGHPIQGALTSYIQIQNDPKGRNQEFSNTKAYWRSRLKATLWNAVYSTQWNLGPISEVTVEKYGAKTRPPWNQDGSWPCTTKNCYTGVGQIDIVMTPIGGLGWLIGEDWMDKNIARRVEDATRNRFLIDTVRCTFNPIRAGANILHGNRPWFRARDVSDWRSSAQP